jgi:hypothetical protein
VKHLRGFAGAVFLLFGVTAPASPPQAGVQLDVAVIDQSKLAVPGVRIELQAPPDPALAVTTDEDGRASFPGLQPGKYRIVIAPPGFETIERELNVTRDGVAPRLTLMLTPAVEKTKIEVTADLTAVEAGATQASAVSGKLAREMPNRPATVADALPLIPGVVREPGGGLKISDAGEHRSALIVNSADVTDPATGQFGLTVPIDSVETLNVFQTPFLAEYGRFSAGLVSVETRRGGDKWKWELNDPLPEFRIRSWGLRGLKTATPRLNFEGPIIPGKLFISEGSEYEVRKTEVYTLPFPRNQKLQSGINSFTQLDWFATDKQLVTATFHAAPQRLGHVNLNYFNPEETTPDAATHNYTATVADKWSIGGGLFENTFSFTHFDASVWPRGGQNLILTPDQNSGNYFSQQGRSAIRFSGLSTFSFAPVKRWGVHHWKLGTYVAGSNEDGQMANHPVDIRDAAGVLTERITYSRFRTFEISDVETNFFVQDHWVLSSRMSVDLGGRVESQQVSHAYRLAPRIGWAWNPIEGQGTVIRAGAGYFYDRVPLNVYCFNKFPDQMATFFDPSGEVIAGPYLYLNTLGQSQVRHPFVFQKPEDGNFSPRSTTWMIQIEQPVSPRLKLRTGYMQSISDGLLILDPLAPDPNTGLGAYLLNGSGSSRYHQFETTARFRVTQKRELFFSYVRSKGRGDLNDFATFVGTFPVPIVRPNYYVNLPADLPNRFLGWGVVDLPAKFRIAPAVEYRSGFPYSSIDAPRQYVGTPNLQRFPKFLSVDSRLSKDIQLDPRYGVRLSVSGFNLTNHFNPEVVHNNVADAAYGYFFGHRGRRFTVDFDFLF